MPTSTGHTVDTSILIELIFVELIFLSHSFLKSLPWMDGCGSFSLDVCEDVMKMEMFLELLPQVCPWSPQGNSWEEDFVKSFFFSFSFFALRGRWQFCPSFMLLSLA